MATRNRRAEHGRAARRGRLTRGGEKVGRKGAASNRGGAVASCVARIFALALAVLLLGLAPVGSRAQSGRRQPGAQPSPSPQRPRRAPATAQDPQPGQPSTPDAPSTTAAPRPTPATPPDADAAVDPASEDDEVYKVESNLVPVSANVSDTTNGRAVIDLKVEDFELRVDGQPKPISDVSFSETPVRLALLFDNSSSIRPTRELEKHAAAGFFRKVLRPVDQGAVFSIGTYPTLDQQLTSDVAKLARTIENYGDVENSTALFDTIVMAAEYLRPMPGRKVIVIVSDGVETTSRLTDFGEVVRRALAADCQIFVIQTGLSDNANLRDLMAERRMVDLTASTGGAVFTPKLAADLEGAFTQISNDLRQQYVLSYYPNDDGRDGRFRSIALRVKTRPNMRVRARRGYYPRRRAGDVSAAANFNDTASFVNQPTNDATVEASPTIVSASTQTASPARPAAPQLARGPVGGSKNMDFDASGDFSRPSSAVNQSPQTSVRLGNFRTQPAESSASISAAPPITVVTVNAEPPPHAAARAPSPSSAPERAASDAAAESKRDDDTAAAAPPTGTAAAADTSKAAPTPQPDAAKQTQPETSNQPAATRARTAPPPDAGSRQTERAGAQQARPAGSKTEPGGEKSQEGQAKPDAPARKILISGGVLNGRALSLPRPAYPEHAVRMKAVGTVSVEVTIDESGKVVEARAVSGHVMLRDAAVAAARRARFSPTLISGQPVQVAGVINYKFTI